MRIYKKEIPDSKDWKTDADDNRINAFREVMAYNNQFQDDSFVGIFWYDIDGDDLFGVYSVNASDMSFYYSEVFGENVRTCKPMHYALWQRGVNRGKDPRFQSNYTDVPRGRVFEYEHGGFAVCVGTWIKDYPSAKQLILDEFNLPDDTEFIVDSHWDLGHGWSDKHF